MAKNDLKYPDLEQAGFNNHTFPSKVGPKVMNEISIDGVATLRRRQVHHLPGSLTTLNGSCVYDKYVLYKMHDVFDMKMNMLLTLKRFVL